MTIVLVILGGLMLSALIVAVVWTWWSTDALDQLTEESRIRVEEQLALWRLQAIRRQAQAEMRRIRNAHRLQSPWDRAS
jgi:hypothetical protein